MSFSTKRQMMVLPPGEVDGYPTTPMMPSNEQEPILGSLGELIDVAPILCLRRAPQCSPQPSGYVADSDGEVTFGALTMNQYQTHGYWRIAEGHEAAEAPTTTHGFAMYPTEQFDGVQYKMRVAWFYMGGGTRVFVSRNWLDTAGVVDTFDTDDVDFQPCMIRNQDTFGLNTGSTDDAILWFFDPMAYGPNLRALGMFNLSTADLCSFEAFGKYKDYYAPANYIPVEVTPNSGRMVGSFKTSLVTDLSELVNFSGPIIEYVSSVAVEPCLMNTGV